MKKIHPILFSTPMVQAILEEMKIMTRRIIKPQPQKCQSIARDAASPSSYSFIADMYDDEYIKGYGKEGDLLWVRETWAKEPNNYIYKADEGINTPFFNFDQKWKPSIFMPKEACRIWLEITNIKVERLQDITEDDAFAEGVKDGPDRYAAPGWGLCQARFKQLWEKINGEVSWNDNPFVWVISFKKTNK